jgi:hypothetical protein
MDHNKVQDLSFLMWPYSIIKFNNDKGTDDMDGAITQKLD